MQILKDSNDQTSSIRFIMLVIVFFIMGSWALVSYQEDQLVEIPQSAIYVLGLIISGKVGQKWIEENIGNIDPKEIAHQVVGMLKIKKG